MRGNSFARGLITGTIIGATMSMIISPMDKKDKKMVRKRTNNLMGSVGDVLEDIVDIIR